MSPAGGDNNPLAGAANLRGGILIALAVVVGVILLGKGFDTGFIGSSGGDPSDQAAGGDDGGDGGGDGTTDASTTTTVALHNPAEVRVQVLNGGATVSGSAGSAGTTISGSGFTVLDAENADVDVAATTVYAAPGYEGDAAAVAGALGLTVAPQPMPAPPPPPAPADAHVVVVLGPDFVPA